MDEQKVVIDPSKVTKEALCELIQLMPAKDATAIRLQMTKLGKLMGWQIISYEMSDEDIIEFQKKITDQMLDMYNDFMKSKVK